MKMKKLKLTYVCSINLIKLCLASVKQHAAVKTASNKLPSLFVINFEQVTTKPFLV